MSVHATFDIGSHSVKMLVAERDPQGGWIVLADRTRITRLGEDLHATGEIGVEAMNRSSAAIADFLVEAHALSVEEMAAVGTMCLRTARNTTSFVSLVRNECGLAIEVIPGEEEARLSFLAAVTALGPQEGTVVVCDPGGGSTEIVFGRGAEVDARASYDVGAIRLTAEYLPSDPVTRGEQAKMLAAIAEALGDLGAGRAVDTLIGVGGTLTNLAAIKHKLAEYDRDVVQGTVLSRSEIEQLLETFRCRTVEERREIVGLEPERAEVILAGTGIVRVILQKLGVAEVMVCDRGLRYGLMEDRFGG